MVFEYIKKLEKIDEKIETIPK